jgi:hypothetical protein
MMSITGQQKLKNLFKVSTLAVLLAASSVVISGQQSFSQSAEQEEEWVVYDLDIKENGNIRYQFAVPYPVTWTQEDNTGGGEGPLIKVSDFFSPTDEEGDFVNVQIWIEVLSSGMGVEDYLDYSIDAYTSSEYEIESSDVGEYTLVGMPAYSFEVNYRDSDFGRQNMLEVGTIIGNKYAFTVTAFADSRIHEDYLPTIQQMINSIALSSGTGVGDTSAEDSGSEDAGNGTRLEGLQSLSERMRSAGGGGRNMTTGGDQIGSQGSIGGGNSRTLGGVFGGSQ